MKSRGLTTWFVVDCLVHVSPNVLFFAEYLTPSLAREAETKRDNSWMNDYD